jgi:hypothetical protein
MKTFTGFQNGLNVRRFSHGQTMFEADARLGTLKILKSCVTKAFAFEIFLYKNTHMPNS